MEARTINYENLKDECLELHTQLEEIGILERSLRLKKMELKAKIEDNLSIQSVFWPGAHWEEELMPKNPGIVMDFFEDSNQTLKQLAEKYHTDETTVSSKITKYFREHENPKHSRNNENGVL